MDYEKPYLLKKYKPRELTKRQIAFCEAYIAGNSANQSMLIAGYNSQTNSKLLKCKRIRDYITKHDGQFVNVPVTFESKMNKIKQVIDTTIPDKITPDNVEFVDYDAGLKAIAEANKMQGHYAATKNVNVNANMEIDSQEAGQLFNKLLEQNKNEF